MKNKRHKMGTKHRDEHGNRHASLLQSLTFTRSFWVSVGLNAVFVHRPVHNLHLFITLFDARLPCTGLGASGRGQKLKTNISGAIERSRSNSKRPHFPLGLHVRQTNQAVGAEIVYRSHTDPPNTAPVLKSNGAGGIKARSPSTACPPKLSKLLQQHFADLVHNNRLQTLHQANLLCSQDTLPVNRAICFRRNHGRSASHAFARSKCRVPQRKGSAQTAVHKPADCFHADWLLDRASCKNHLLHRTHADTDFRVPKMTSTPHPQGPAKRQSLPLRGVQTLLSGRPELRGRNNRWQHCV